MGWAGANSIFDPVAYKMTELGVAPEVKTEVLAELIRQMQMGDWDTEGESLDEFQGDPAIVEAFRRNGVILHCGQIGSVWCELERGHSGDVHKDYAGKTWTEPRVR